MRKYCDIDGFYNYTRNSVEEFGSPDKRGNFWVGNQVITVQSLDKAEWKLLDLQITQTRYSRSVLDRRKDSNS
jgi:hypothetical protein